jgi:hypothetical protein
MDDFMRRRVGAGAANRLIHGLRIAQVVSAEIKGGHLYAGASQNPAKNFI